MRSDRRSDRRHGRTAQPPAVIPDDPWLLVMSANLLAVFGTPHEQPKPSLARLIRSGSAEVVRLIGRGFGRFRESRRRAAAIRELRAKDDRMLRDMGLARGQITAAVEGRLDRGRPAPPRELKAAPLCGAAQKKPLTPAAAGRCTDGELDAAA